MTNEEAIQHFEYYIENEYYTEKHRQACRMACATLRAQQTPMDRSRWEGCEYCDDPQPYKDCVLPDGTERILCSQDGLFGDCYINERTIKFCPFCGKPLTEEAWAELDRRINGGKTD